MARPLRVPVVPLRKPAEGIGGPSLVRSHRDWVAGLVSRLLSSVRNTLCPHFAVEQPVIVTAVGIGTPLLGSGSLRNVSPATGHCANTLMRLGHLFGRWIHDCDDDPADDAKQQAQKEAGASPALRTANCGANATAEDGPNAEPDQYFGVPHVRQRKSRIAGETIGADDGNRTRIISLEVGRSGFCGRRRDLPKRAVSRRYVGCVVVQIIPYCPLCPADVGCSRHAVGTTAWQCRQWTPCEPGYLVASVPRSKRVAYSG